MAYPVLLNAGRVAPEKNLVEFPQLRLSGTKVEVGDGHQLGELNTRFPEAVFAGAQRGVELAAYYVAADVFVFPSLTATFGLVMPEAMAGGTLVAAYPVTGPLDVLWPGVTGVMDRDLGRAVVQATSLDRARCREEALAKGWGRIAEQFLQALVPLNSDKAGAWRCGTWESQVTAV